jgi:hypothetical protein
MSEPLWVLFGRGDADPEDLEALNEAYDAGLELIRIRHVGKEPLLHVYENGA